MEAHHTRAMVLLLGAIWGLCTTAVQAQTLEEQYEVLNTAYENEDYERILAAEVSTLKLLEGRRDSLAASTWGILGETQYFAGDMEVAVGYLATAYELHNTLGLTDHDEFGNILYNLTYLHYELGDYAPAEEYGKQLLARDQMDFGSGSEEYVNSVVTLADIYRAQGKYRETETLVLSALKDADSKTFPYFILETQLGDYYTRQGNFRAAERYLLPALALIQYLEGSNTVEYAATLISLATMYQRWGRFPEGERFYMDSQEILENQAPDPLRDQYLGTIKNNLATLYIDMARYQDGANLLAELEEEDAENFGTDHPNYGITLLNHSRALRKLGDFENAAPKLAEAQQIFMNTLGEDHIATLTSQEHEVNLLTAQGNYEAANALMNDVLKSIKSSIGTSSDLYTRSVFEQGLLYAKVNNVRRAKKSLRRAQQLGAEVYSERHPGYARTTRQLAVLNWYDDDPEAAIAAYETTFENYFGQIDAYFPALSEPEKAKFYNQTLKVTFEEFNSFAVANAAEFPELLGKMYDYQLATKALIMYSTSKVREAISNSNDEALMTQFNDWLSLKERISKMYSMSQEELEKEPESLASLLDQANRIEKQLGESSREFEDTFNQSQVRWQEVRDALADGEAAIEIIRFRNFVPDRAGEFDGSVHYAALVVRHDTQDHPELVLIKNGAELEADWVAYYRNSVIYRLIDSQSYGNFWEPIKGQLSGIEKVFISPDGLYHQVSFNTLLNPESGEFLLDEVQVEQVSNTKEVIAYANMSEQGFRTGDALFFGYPNYNLGLDAETLAAAEIANKVANTVSLDRGLRGSLKRYVNDNELLAMLPGTKAEVEIITQLYEQQNRGYVTFMENEAVEEQIKNMEAPSTLHIATHGFFLEDTPEATAGDNDGYVANPLLRSGLILAGANTFIAAGVNESTLTEEDGILTAFEVMNLNLAGTDLVVLSACETGLGTIKNGEGVYGLQRAFRVAGANAIIMSLWSVNDQATQELMSLFYKNWLETGNKQQAFLEAQKQLREKFPDPFYWGAFVMVGR